MISGGYDKELDIRDRMIKHALVMGDYMASGVMQYLVPQSASVNYTSCCFGEKLFLSMFNI
ncbi:MAG TPA: hypothetical protein VM577_03130 [Anaerovoracaceae bacterium]|nr:hypothetical protein [Anaerovoracaceae bacterium]